MANIDFGAGFSAMARAGSGLIQSSIEDDRRQNAEKIAADRSLDTAERMMAIQEAFKNRAAERFAELARTKQQEQVPLEAPTVASTGLTQASTAGAGDGGSDLETGIQGDAATIKNITAQAQAILNDPKASQEKKDDARGLLEQMSRQIAAQKTANVQSVEGMTRARTPEEAARAAVKEAMLSDPSAALAGAGMIHTVLADDMAEKKLAQQERIKQMEIEQKDRREVAANSRAEAREDNRLAIALAQIQAHLGKTGGKSAEVEKFDYFQNVLGMTKDQVINIITEKKHIPVEDIAVKILSGDKFGEMTPKQAYDKALEIARARDAYKGGVGADASGSMPRLKWDPSTGTFK